MAKKMLNNAKKTEQQVVQEILAEKAQENLTEKAAENIVKMLFVKESKNGKTGPISQTYTEKILCPHRCRLQSLCYAKFGPCGLVSEKITEHWFLIKDLKDVLEHTAHTKLIRHNVAGDMAIMGTSTLDRELVELLADAYHSNNCLAYTYTHCEITEDSAEIVKQAAEKDFIINFSCETIEEVKHALELGCNAVITVKSISNKVVKKDGITFMRCPFENPEETRMQCCQCKMCARNNRNKVVPAFTVHGAGKNKETTDGVKLLNL